MVLFLVKLIFCFWKLKTKNRHQPISHITEIKKYNDDENDSPCDAVCIKGFDIAPIFPNMLTYDRIRCPSPPSSSK